MKRPKRINRQALQRVQRRTTVLEQLIRARGLTKKELGQDIRRTPSTIKKYSIRPETMSGKMRRKMATALDIKIEHMDAICNRTPITIEELIAKQTREPRKYVRHSMTGHPVMNSYNAMMARCRTGKSYLRKGITVCDEWKENFWLFYNHVTSLPSYNKDRIGVGKDKLTLDRIRNEGNYEPGNVRWVTPKEQWENSDNAVKHRVNVKN